MINSFMWHQLATLKYRYDTVHVYLETHIRQPLPWEFFDWKLLSGCCPSAARSVYFPLWETTDFFFILVLPIWWQPALLWRYFPTWVLSTKITLFLADATARGSVISVSCTIDMDLCILDDYFKLNLNLASSHFTLTVLVQFTTRRTTFSYTDLTITTNSVTLA